VVSVYVDNARNVFGRMKMAHMIADSSAELHAMAAAIGVARKWCQHAGTAEEHYDIALSKRSLAIAGGAVEITTRELAKRVRARRAS
jgi:hypothetical protein